ncbi:MULTISPECIES: aldehyde dehydrogenase family protein [Shigella]|uniref:aldehyde dehydrogenase family protein n=1 Tax=Shigella TaxID=620 RepID=UPI0012610B92|nr:MULTISPECIES: aldehyde dehydrogenase family protein [Shigella]
MQHKLLINGERVSGEGEKQPVYNPATGDVLLEIAEVSAEQVDAAVRAADAAFAEWGQTTPKARAECLLKLAKACPKGIDIYYENVGGKVFDAVLPLLNTSARIPVCGLVSSYNATELPPGPDRLPLLMATVLKKRIRLQGFIIAQDYGHRIHEFQKEMGQWVKEDKIHYREDITDGLENAPQTFIGLLKGKNFGKVVIRVAGDD